MTKFVWKRPAKSEIVVFDGFATQGIISVMSEDSYSIFANRRSILHIWALLHMLTRLRCSWLDYCVSYLSLSGARVVVTCIDSNPLFYRLKHHLPQVRFIAIQNGIRGTGSPVKGGDFWSALAAFGERPPHVDVVATFGAAHSEQYSAHIQCVTVEVGSTRSNSIPIQKKLNVSHPPRIALISNFSGLPHQDIFPGGVASATAMYLHEQRVAASDYFAADARVANLISNICSRNKWEFSIVGRRDQTFPHEQRFFADACADNQFNFVVKHSETSAYEYLDRVDLVVAIDSTLGYEMIARAARVLFISARAALLSSEESRQFKFGFPGNYSEEGAFWTESLHQSEIEQLMHSVLGLSEDGWKSCSEFVTRELMVHDPDNKRFLDLLKTSHDIGQGHSK